MSVLRFLIRLAILSSLCTAPLLAQGGRNGDAVPAGEGIPWNVGVGYSFVSMNVSGNPSLNLNGFETNATMDFHPRWGVTFDSSYVRAGRDPGSGHSSYVFSALTGPVFVARQSHKTRLLVRALAGVSLVDSSVQVNQLYYRGWQSRFSWAAGAGIERNLSAPFAVRLDVDYLRTKFMSSTAVVQPQNGIRVSASFVLRFSPRRETR